MKQATFRTTVNSCYIGYISQAIVNNFTTLLFVMFGSEFGISLVQISVLIAANFGVQLLTDIVSTRFVDKIGYRAASVGAHFLCAAGLFLLPVLPYVVSPFAGLIVSTVFTGVGGGLIEVVISPIVEACPSENKAKAMSMLHSFYCWGQMGVVLVSTVVFKLAGIGAWRWLSCCWALIPLINAFSFFRVPINTLPHEAGKTHFSSIFRQRVFWLFALMMLCAGASELAMSQWASAFAEAGLGVSKAMGDLLGPCMFAVFMGISRVFYGKRGEKIRLSSYIAASGALCVAGYAITVFSPWPVVSLVGCMVCGLAVGIMWPGTYSLAIKAMPLGGTTLFALFALAGDMGCLSGPTLAGRVSAAFGSNLKAGFAFASLFPALMLALSLVYRHREK